ncbi:MAG: cell division protein ZapA [Alphaproteobacteria bacterium]|nr:cell division protein ZapA [Alphaproteobacteria bacterium]
MPLVNVLVNGRAFTVACDEGEEEHLKELGAHVDKKVRELLESVGQVGDLRLLLMAALLIADEHHDVATQLTAARQELSALKSAENSWNTDREAAERVAADALENAAKTVEQIAASLAH